MFGGAAADFDFSKEILAMQGGVRRFARQVIAPRAAGVDRRSRFPEDVFAGFQELGVLGSVYPAEFGGGGLGLLGLCLAIEEVTKYSA